jgi:hypothetical protein
VTQASPQTINNSCQHLLIQTPDKTEANTIKDTQRTIKMPIPPIHRRHDSTTTSYNPRPSTMPQNTYNQSQTFTQTTNPPIPSSTPSMSQAKTRQYAHLQAQLAQLNANLADTENLLRMTAVQAGDMRFLGGYMGALFMGSAKILGEEGVRANADLDSRDAGVKKEEASEEE